MLCNISGKTPSEPVVSRVNGSLFDRRLVEAYLSEHGKCPVTGQPMSTDDLMPVQSGPVTQSTAAQNGSDSIHPGTRTIPGLLSTLQAEWDSAMLEQFSLRQQLAATERSLTHALYQHDAACRVISRLVKERDAALRIAGQPVPEEGKPVGATEVQVGEDGEGDDGLPDDVCADIDSHMQRLKGARKRYELPATAATTDEVAGFVEATELKPMHTDATGVAVGVRCVAVDDTNGSRTVYSGGADGTIYAFDARREAVVGSLVGHTKAVKQIQAVHGDAVVSCAADGETRVWRTAGAGNAGYRCAQVLSGHANSAGGVAGLAVMPTGRHVLTAAADGVSGIQFSDLDAGVTLATGTSDELVAAGISSLALHPDGLMAATGSGSAVQLWDVKAMDKDLTIGLRDGGAVSALSFCEDGVTMAVGTKQGVVQLWDLRKIDEPVSVPFEAFPAVPITRVAFDPTRQFLAIAGNGVRLWAHKSAAPSRELAVLSGHLSTVHDVAWGADAQWLASGGGERCVKLWSSTGKL